MKLARNPWARARSLADLGDLTARWLEGDKSLEHPDYFDGPDDETAPLIPVLAAANRAGIVTTDSQPGDAPGPGFDGAVWAQRPAVMGVTNADMMARLDRAADAAGLFLKYVITAPKPWHSWRYPVTTRDGEGYTWYGVVPWARQCETFGGTRNLAPILAPAWQFLLIDMEWTDRSLLWDVLGGAARSGSMGGGR